jgi:hypothetical protein
VNLRLLVVPLATTAVLSACGGSSTPSAADASATPSPSAAASVAATTAAAPGASASGGATTSTTASADPATTSAAAQGAGSAPSTAAATKTAPGTTAPGSYTYDTSGTVTAGTPRDASGTATLTVDPASGGKQHSVLADDQGSTDQDAIGRTTGTYLARLAIANPAFNKEFRFTTPVLLVPEPAAPGRSWSWTATSTDGKTTVAVSARITRRENVTVGGVPTPTSLVTSTLKLTGDVTYTAQMQTWYDPAHRLSVKDHSRGNGTFGGVAFTTDITSVLRSTRPA